LIVLVPHNEAFEQRAAGWLALTLGSFITGALLWLGVVFLSPLKQAKVAHWRDHNGAEENPYAVSARDFLIPNRRNYGLAVLLDANVLVFAAMVLAGLGFTSFDAQDLLKWGANYGPALHGPGLFRLITSEFVHSGSIELLFSMFGLVYAALFLLPATGNLGLIACYLLAGLGGSIASAVFRPATVSVGSSGAICGLFGILLTLTLLRDERVEDAGQLVFYLAILAGITFFLNATFAVVEPAQVGGLATGALLGLGIFFLKRPEQAARGQ
jgi:rhomboid protease GluP